MPVTVASAGVGDEGRRGVHVSLAVAAGAGDEDPHEEAMHEMEQAWHLGQARKKEFREAMRTARGGKGAQGGGQHGARGGSEGVAAGLEDGQPPVGESSSSSLGSGLSLRHDDALSVGGQVR